MKTRTLRCTVLASLLAVASAGALAEVKIGFLATMSGSAAALGQDQYDGFMLALEQKGGKLGNVPIHAYESVKEPWHEAKRAAK